QVLGPVRSGDRVLVVAASKFQGMYGTVAKVGAFPAGTTYFDVALDGRSDLNRFFPPEVERVWVEFMPGDRVVIQSEGGWMNARHGVVKEVGGTGYTERSRANSRISPWCVVDLDPLFLLSG